MLEPEIGYLPPNLVQTFLFMLYFPNHPLKAVSFLCVAFKNLIPECSQFFDSLIVLNVFAQAKVEAELFELQQFLLILCTFMNPPIPTQLHPVYVSFHLVQIHMIFLLKVRLKSNNNEQIQPCRNRNQRLVPLSIADLRVFCQMQIIEIIVHCRDILLNFMMDIGAGLGI